MLDSRGLRTRLQLLLIPVAAFIAISPLVRNGCSCGHDFDFHLLSWMEAARQFAHGNLHPQWAFTPASNAGEPRFVFYPPISWMLGALLGMLLTHLPDVSEAAAWNAVPIVFTWIALTLSGLAMFRLARAFAGRNAALLASIVYLANPYMLFTAYERTAYGELLAAAWIPLLLLGILGERVTPGRIAIPLALLWLTNAPAAIMGSYMLAVLAGVRIAMQLRREAARVPFSHRVALHLTRNAVSGALLGLALAAFYILPAAYERRYIQAAMATIGGMSIGQNFLFEHTGASPDALAHDVVLHAASMLAVILLAAAALTLAAAFFALRVRRRSQTSILLPLATLAAGVGFLLTPASLALWNHLPEAALLQFPWRLLAILMPVAALALAMACDWPLLKTVPAALVSLLLAAAMSHSAYANFVQPCDVEDTAPARLALFRSNAGTDPTDEYTPAAADNDSLTPNAPPWWLAASPLAAPPAGSQPGLAPMHFAVTAPQHEDLIVNLRDYPAWRVRINGTVVAQRRPRPDGLIAVPVSAGTTAVDISYAEGTDHAAGIGVSLVACVLLLVNAGRRSTLWPSGGPSPAEERVR